MSEVHYSIKLSLFLPNQVLNSNFFEDKAPFGRKLHLNCLYYVLHETKLAQLKCSHDSDTKNPKVEKIVTLYLKDLRNMAFAV